MTLRLLVILAILVTTLPQSAGAQVPDPTPMSGLESVLSSIFPGPGCEKKDEKTGEVSALGGTKMHNVASVNERGEVEVACQENYTGSSGLLFFCTKEGECFSVKKDSAQGQRIAGSLERAIKSPVGGGARSAFFGARDKAYIPHDTFLGGVYGESVTKNLEKAFSDSLVGPPSAEAILIGMFQGEDPEFMLDLLTQENLLTDMNLRDTSSKGLHDLSGDLNPDIASEINAGFSTRVQGERLRDYTLRTNQRQSANIEDLRHIRHGYDPAMTSTFFPVVSQETVQTSAVQRENSFFRRTTGSVYEGIRNATNTLRKMFDTIF